MLFACSDHRLYGVEAPPVGSGPAPVDSADVPDTADTGEPLPTPCEPEASLEAGDEVGVIEIGVGEYAYVRGSGIVAGASAVWLQLRPERGVAAGHPAFLPVVASDFLAGGVNYDSPSAIYHSGRLSAGWYATVGLTTTDGHEGEALTWDDPYLDPTTSWVVMPDEHGPLDLSTVEPAFRLEEDTDWSIDNLLAADFDGDGFDDMLRWHGPTRLMFTAPYTTTRTLADVDQEWPYLIDGTFLDGSVGTFADLDGDGHIDYVQRWREYDAFEAELRWFRGPLVERADLSAPDGYVALAGADRFDMARDGQDRGVGDVSGDGRDDVVVSADMSPEAGRDAVYLIDAPPGGGRDVEEFPAVDHSTQAPPETNVINPMLVGDPGDWNGDGRADLVFFQALLDHTGDPARAWLVAGPVTSDVDLATDATPLTLSTKLVDSNRVWVSVVPDLTGDGADDLVATLGNGGATSPAELWLFPGCAE